MIYLKRFLLLPVMLSVATAGMAQELDSLMNVCYRSLDKGDTATFNLTYPKICDAYEQKYDEMYEVRKVLDRLRKSDQSIRILVIDLQKKLGKNGHLLPVVRRKMHEIDKENAKVVASIIDKYGWLGTEDIGDDGNQTLFLCIQHCEDSVIQHKYLPIIEDAVHKGNAKPWHFAFLTDRILMNQGKPQVYGTQTVIIDGRTYPVPLQNPREVDALRKSIGMESLDEYMQEHGEHFSVEDYLKEEATINEKFQRWFKGRNEKMRQ